jgi:hypothetical protein
MTVAERLNAGASSAEALREAEIFIVEHLPLDRAVLLTDDAIHAALHADPVRFALAIAPEVEPEPDELEALRELDAEPERPRTVTLEEYETKYGLR